MQIFLYISQNVESGRRLLRLILKMGRQKNIMSFVSLDEAKKQLKLSVHSGDILIFLADTDEELNQLYAIKDVVDDVRIILILPNNQPETLALAHLLRPRFITYIDRDVAEVGSVFQKMLNHVADSSSS